MFHSLAVGWADLVLPATAALEREGTSMNLEGRVQRLRRAVTPPVPDELAWLAKLAERFDVELSPHAAVVFEELSERIYGGLELETARRARAAARARRRTCAPAAGRRRARAAGATRQGDHFVGTLRLLRYRRSSRGHQVERVPELQFQRPEREVALSAADADRRGIATGDPCRSARTAPRWSSAPGSTASSSRASPGSPRSTPPTSTSTSRSCSA